MGPSQLGKTTSVRIGHLCIEVTDLERSDPFYSRFLGRLGFHRFVKESGYAGYSNGELSIWLVQENPSRVRRHPITGEEEVVADHVGFLVPTAEEVAHVQSDLEQQEVYPTFRTAEHPEFRPGYVSASWVDPDHVVLEVYHVPAPKPKRTARPARRARRARRATPRRPKRRSGARRRGA